MRYLSGMLVRVLQRDRTNRRSHINTDTGWSLNWILEEKWDWPNGWDTLGSITWISEKEEHSAHLGHWSRIKVHRHWGVEESREESRSQFLKALCDMVQSFEYPMSKKELLKNFKQWRCTNRLTFQIFLWQQYEG